MEHKEGIRIQILESQRDLQSRNSYLSNDDIAADIINVTCRYIIDHNILRYKASSQPMQYFHYNWANCSPFVTDVIMSLSNDMNGIINSQTVQALTQNICFNLGWAEMPTFLEQYFYEKHGLFTDTEKEYYDFMSINHERFVYGELESKSQVDRNIKVVLSNEKNSLCIEINPTLSLKRGKLERKTNNLYTYRGEDPDYVFEIGFDDFDEINFVSVSLISRSLKLNFH